ncbi:Ubiquitin-conjugating enzyme E2-binding protein [Phytophthora cactorum]|nr:Ubiquitin-conjugating enzyme E2-binding protein [Phytophthora cactorum]
MRTSIWKAIHSPHYGAEAKALLKELRAAQEEHECALAAANQYEEARAAEKASEDELAKAAESLARGLQNLEGTTGCGASNSGSMVEYHANIGCYQCYLFLDRHKQLGKEEETFDVAKLHVHVEFPRVELAYKSQSGGERCKGDVEVVWWTEIERNVDVSLCSLEDKEDHWYLRLPIRPSDKQPLGGSPRSHKCLALSYNRIATLTRRYMYQDREVLPLPSANWMDMFDFWGAGIGAFEHIPRDDIQAQKRRVLIGESYVLLHASDFVAEATMVDREDAAVAPGDDAKEEREWVPLTCAACSERVGLSNVEQPDTIRLHKHLINARRHLKSATEEEENVFANYTIDSILSAKLLEMADADGKFRFVLTSSGDKYLETMIKQQDATKFRRVLKVLYGPRQPMPAIPGLLSSHEVSLPPAMYSAITQRLETSSTLLPSSMRAFNRMNVGYLFA